MSFSMKSFEECVEKVSYGNKIQRTEYLSEGKYPVVSQESKLINGFWNNEADVFTVDKPVIVFGDHTRALKFIDFSFVLGADGAKIIKPKSFVDTKFFYYFLQANPLGAKGYARHYRFLKELALKVPPLATQKKIVAKLDAIFAEIDKATAAAEANAKNAEALFQSYLDKLFEEDAVLYKKIHIKEVCKIGDGNHSSKYPKKDEMVESGIPFIRSTNIINGALSAKELVYLTEAKHKELKKGHLKTGDVLITNRGEIGKVAIVDERFNNANLNSQIAWLRCNPNLKNQYLLFFLMSANMKKFYSDTKTGAALQQLPIGKIERIQIPLPSMEVQETRCSEFMSIQEKCLVATLSYENKLIQLYVLKQAILKQAFNGELLKG